MHGHPLSWRPGTDHAGIATQTVVERHLNLTARSDLGREGLVAQIEAWRNEYGGRILRQMERMGSSADPALEYYTLGTGLSEAVARAFVRLYEEGLVYRSTRMVNWSVKAGTALSEIEVVVNDVMPEGHVDGYVVHFEPGYVRFGWGRKLMSAVWGKIVRSLGCCIWWHIILSTRIRRLWWQRRGRKRFLGIGR